MPVVNRIAEFHEDMKVWRHELHAHPELGYEEHWTSDFIASKLESFGIDVIRGMAGTGVVGRLTGMHNKSGRAIGLRADMDALAMDEANDFAHKSEHKGKMHACGHDGHMSMLLGAARYLAETRHFDGEVYFIFQPAEEGGAGGKAMIDDGLFETCAVETVWGMHNWPGLAVGDIAISDGPCMASADHFTITLRGQGSHAAMPHQASDPVLASANLIQTIQMIVSRHTDPVNPAVVSVTMINGGSAFNVIPDEVSLSGTIRAISSEARHMMQEQMQHIARSVAAAHGCVSHFEMFTGYPPTINHLSESQRAAHIAADIVGADHIHRNLPPSMAAEDFAFMLEQKPGCYIWVGAGEAQSGKMLHNTGYDFNDDILSTGASYWARLAESELAIS